MKFIFIVNPVAGKADAARTLVPRIEQACSAAGVEYKVHITAYHGHAAEIARGYAQAGEPACLYACGGDGTLNEVVQSCIGCETVWVGSVPCGSGNDYIRNFGDVAAFLDIGAQLQGNTAKIDAIKTSYGYSVAICAVGLDAKVAYGIPKFRRLPFCGGSTAYTLSILQTFCGPLGNRMKITVDDTVFTGNYMMTAICNGRMYGGGYLAAPLGCMDDDLLDIVLVKHIPRIKIPGFLALYKQGLHLTPEGRVVEQFAPYLSYMRARRISLQTLGDRPVIATLDGECAPYSTLSAEVVPRCLNIVLPKNIAPAQAAALSGQG